MRQARKASSHGAMLKGGLTLTPSIRRKVRSFHHIILLELTYHTSPEMISIPTPPPTPGPSKRPGYPNSMRYWETYQRKTSDVGIQTLQLPDFKLEPVIHVARETKETKEPMPLLGAYPNVAPPLPATVEIPLSNEQKHVLELVKAGHSLFFTGAAGK